MGGADFYCAISGTTHMHDEDAIPRDIFSDFGGDWMPDEVSLAKLRKRLFRGEDGSKEAWHLPSEQVLKGLKLSADDLAATEDCVLIAGCAPLAEDSVTDGPQNVLLTQQQGTPEGPAPGAKRIFNVARVEEGCYSPVSGNEDEQPEWHSIWYTPTTGFYITFPAYCILATVAPEFHLDPSLLYRVMAGSPGDAMYDSMRQRQWIQTPVEVEYGIVDRTFNQFAVTLAVCEGGKDGNVWEDLQRWWLKLLCCDEKSNDEILEEAWTGKGGLWAYKRPDRFPIAKAIASPSLPDFPCETDWSQLPLVAFENLPLEIIFLISQRLPLPSLLGLLSLNKSMRSRLLPHTDEIAYRAMEAMEPWYFPSNPLPPKSDCGGREREELDWWEGQWLSDGDIDAGDLRANAPWLRYWIQCKWDANMMNRKRIWRCAESVRALGIKMGLID